MNASQTETVRKSFRDYIRRHSGAELPSSMLETTLIRDGSYCGRRFSLLGYSLIWFLDEQQIKLYAQDGSLLLSKGTREFCGSPSLDVGIRRAA